MNEKMRGRRITCLAFDARGAELSLLTKLLTTRQTSRCSVQCVRLWTANIICWAASGCTHAHTDACTGLHWSELDTQPAQTHTHTMCAAAKPPNPKSRDRPDQVGIVASGIMHHAGRLLGTSAACADDRYGLLLCGTGGQCARMDIPQGILR